MEQLTEASLSRLQSKTAAHDCAAMSAFRADADEATNKRNSAKVKTALESAGYSVTAIRGSYIENAGTDKEKKRSEDSFFVENSKDSPDFVKTVAKLGATFDQDAVLIIPKGGKGAHLYGTTRRDGACPAFGQQCVVGKTSFGGATEEYFSTVGGHACQFKDATVLSASEFDAAYPRPQTVNGKMGERLHGKTILQDIASDPALAAIK